MGERRTEMPVERQAELEEAFTGAYLASSTRPAVDVFLHAIFGSPGPS